MFSSIPRASRRVQVSVAAVLSAFALALIPGAALANIYYSDSVSFTDAGCGHYGFARYDSDYANVKGYTMPTSSGTACQYNGTGVNYGGIMSGWTWGDGIIYKTGSASLTGLAHSGGSVYKVTYLTTNPR